MPDRVARADGLNTASARSSEFPLLASPLQVGPMQLRNRCVVPGHSMRLGGGDGLLTERWRRYLVERARGGAAWVGIESAPVSSETRTDLSPLQLYNDDVIPGLETAAREVHASGAKLSVILWHGGHHVPASGGQAAIAPSAMPSYITGETPRAMDCEDIARLIRCYASAAARCAAAGLDAVEIQTSSDYLLGSFLSPRLNRRRDHYGGPVANRVRIVQEILQAVRKSVGPTVAVGVRTSVGHHIPGDPQDYGVEDSLAAMILLTEGGHLDYLSLIDGSHWSMERIIAPMGDPNAAMARSAALFKRELRIPIILSGRIRLPAEAEALLESQQADLIGMARTWIAEPQWFNKAVTSRTTEIRPCMSCNQGCLGNVSRGIPGTCVINVAAAREFLLGDPAPVSSRRSIAVVGAGPAGLECARVAAERGHDVVLYERSSQVGGQMRLAGNAPRRSEILAVIAWWERELARLGVRVVTGAAVTQGALGTADRVVWAIGSENGPTAVWRRRPWLSDGIPGTTGLPHGREVLLERIGVRGNVLVIDEEGGWPAISLLQFLIQRPCVSHLTVVTADRRFGDGESFDTVGVGVTQRLSGGGRVAIYEEALVAEVDGSTATLTDGRRLGPFDAIVLSTGTSAPEWPSDALVVGDCVAPRGFWAAVNDANQLARRL